MSRGYGRKTRDFKLVFADSKVIQVGDEPLQYAQKFQDVSVAVQEDRVRGIKKLIKKGLSTIVLDDAFQHRWVQAGLNILLTSYNNLYIDDFLTSCRKTSRRKIKRIKG